MTLREAAGELRWVQLLPLSPTGSECVLTLPTFSKVSDISPLSPSLPGGALPSPPCSDHLSLMVSLGPCWLSPTTPACSVHIPVHRDVGFISAFPAAGQTDPWSLVFPA